MLLGENDFPAEMNRIEAHILHAVYMGNMVDIFFRLGDRTFRTVLPPDQILQEGTTAWFGVPFKKTHVLRG